MIEASFRAALMTRAGGTPAAGVALPPTLGVAVGVPPVAGSANPERPVAAPAAAHPKRRLHGSRGWRPALSPLDSRGNRRHTPVVEHVSTCQTPRARSLKLRVLTCSGPSQLRATLPQTNPFRRDVGQTASFLRF